MALKPCRECKKKVSTQAATCPNCGAPKPTFSEIPVNEDVLSKGVKSISQGVESFKKGFYGKDLGHTVEFKSEIQLSLDLFSNSELGFSYNHISNASLGDKNPGTNSYMFNFLKKF